MERLMSPPTYFDVEYSINPWMDVAVPVDTALAADQWQHLYDTLVELGDTIHLVDAAPGLPDMTFSGDAGMVWKRTFVPSNFRHPERQGEVAHYLPWFEANGYAIRPMPEDVVFEGLGDVVFHNARAFVGHGIRSDQRAIDVLGEVVPELEVLGSLEIVDDHYFHLAMALGFIDDDTVVYYPPAFTAESEVVIQKAVANAIPVSAEDANTFFACNNLVIGDTVLIDGCTPALREDLGAYGYTVRTVPMSEFKKSGGSLRCLVLSFM